MSRPDKFKALASADGSSRAQTLRNTYIGKDGDDQQPYIALKYYHPEHECLSSWSAEELKDLSNLSLKLQSMCWSQVKSQGGSVGKKTGLGMTKHTNVKKLPHHPKMAQISPDVSFFELRANQVARVHGFRVDAAFFLCWLDRGHKVYPS